MADRDTAANIAATPRVSEGTHPDLYANVGNLLAGLRDSTDPADLPPVDEGPTDETEILSDGDAAEGSEVVLDEQPDAGDDTGGDEGAASTDPTLPAAIRRSLKAYQWTDEEIDEAFGRDPDGFLPMASKIHSTRVQEMQNWAALGRQQREEADAGPADSDPTPPATAFPDGGLGRIDFDKLAADSGFDKETLVKAFGPVATTIDAINAILPALNDGVQTVQRNKQAELARQIDQFFQSTDMVPYTEFYGKSWDNADNDQIGHRNKVLELADHMIVGAAHHGRSLSPFEAMELAHHTVSSEVTGTAIRKQIAEQVGHRRKGVSLKPTSKTAPPSSGPMARDQILSNAAQRLNAIFG